MKALCDDQRTYSGNGDAKCHRKRPLVSMTLVYKSDDICVGCIYAKEYPLTPEPMEETHDKKMEENKKEPEWSLSDTLAKLYMDSIDELSEDHLAQIREYLSGYSSLKQRIETLEKVIQSMEEGYHFKSKENERLLKENEELRKQVKN